MRRTLLLLAFEFAWHLSAAYGQEFNLPPLTPEGQPIVGTVTGLEDGSKIGFKVGPGASFLKSSGNSAHFWGVKGVQNPVLLAISPPGDAPITFIEKVFAIGDAPPTPPPAPVVKTLAQLAGHKAAALGEMYATLLADVEAGGFESVDDFRTVHDIFLADLKLTPHGAEAEIDKRLKVETIEQLKAALAKIVEELGAAPVPPEPDEPDVPTTTATAATYVYEKDDGGVPPAVGAALSELNTDKFRATTFEEDTTDSDGDVPDQYKAPLAAAQEAGLPSLVVTAGGKAVKVVKAPTTREQVLEAVR